MMPTLAWPLALLLLPLPWLAGRCLPWRDVLPALHMPGRVLLQEASPLRILARRGGAKGLAALIWFCLVVALARPLWPVDVSPAPRPQQLLLVLDISASMDAEDLLLHGKPASRLMVAKAIAAELIQNLTVDQAGLVVFGSHAHVHTPITRDKAALLDGMMALQTGLAGKGSALGEAIALASARLGDMAARPPLMIVLSDGDAQREAPAVGDTPPLLQASGSKIHTLLIAGAPPATRAGLEPGGPVGLRQLAEQTGGAFARVAETESLRAFLQTIQQVERENQLRPTTGVWREVYPWPLALALVLSVGLGLYLNRRYGG